MEPIVNPVMEDPVKHLLGLNKNDFENIVSGKYGVIRRGRGRFDLVDTHKDDDLIRTIHVANAMNKEASEEGDTLVGVTR